MFAEQLFSFLSQRISGPRYRDSHENARSAIHQRAG